jgi:hypothetical protein
MFSSSTSPFAAQLLKIRDELLYLFTSNSEGLEICLARLGLRWDIDPNRRAMACNSDWCFRFQIARQILPELTNSDPGALDEVLRFRTHC